MNFEIKPVPKELFGEAVNIFTEGFSDDPLFLFAFPETKQRKRLTRLMYEFVVYDMVSILNLTIKGAFADGKLAGCIIYTSTESNEWNYKIMQAATYMRQKAGDQRINIIGEFAMLGGIPAEGEYFYGNELAVKKEFRRQGIGKALLGEMIKNAKNHTDVKGILIDTANKNEADMYRRWGWELKAVKDFYEIEKYFLTFTITNKPGKLI